MATLGQPALQPDTVVLPVVAPVRDRRLHYKLGVVGAVLTGMAKMLFVYDLVEREPNCPIVPLSDAAE